MRSAIFLELSNLHNYLSTQDVFLCHPLPATSDCSIAVFSPDVKQRSLVINTGKISPWLLLAQVFGAFTAAIALFANNAGKPSFLGCDVGIDLGSCDERTVEPTSCAWSEADRAPGKSGV